MTTQLKTGRTFAGPHQRWDFSVTIRLSRGRRVFSDSLARSPDALFVIRNIREVVAQVSMQSVRMPLNQGGEECIRPIARIAMARDILRNLWT